MRKPGFSGPNGHAGEDMKDKRVDNKDWVHARNVRGVGMGIEVDIQHLADGVFMHGFDSVGLQQSIYAGFPGAWWRAGHRAGIRCQWCKSPG